MQQVERRDVAKNGFSPLKGSLIVAVLALAGAAFLLLTNNDPKPTPPNTTNAPTSLSTTEAINAVQSLQGLLFDAYRTLDKSLIEDFAVLRSELANTVESEIDRLRKEDVTPVPEYEFREFEVISRSSTAWRIQGEVISSSRFLNHRGEDVTKQPARELQTIVWTLQLVDTEWRLADATITSAEKL